MFKTRIKQWGLDKKNKEHEMLAIIRKQRNREAVGKTSSFRVRGRTVDMTRVEYHFKRKGVSMNEVIRTLSSPAPSTPSAISCFTPSPAAVSEGPSLDMVLERSSPGLFPAQLCLPQFEEVDLYRLLSLTPDIARPLNAPLSLETHEMIAVNLEYYLKISPESETRCLFEVEAFTGDGVWYNSWRTGCDLFRLGKHVEAGNCIRGSSDMVKGLLKERAASLLVGICRLIPSFRYYSKGFDAAPLENLFLKHLAEMSSTILQSEHPISVIILNLLRSDTRDEISISVLSQMVSILEQKLSIHHDIVFGVRLYLAQQLMILGKHAEADIQAGLVFQRCDGAVERDHYSGRALLLLADNLYHQRNFAACQSLLYDVLRRAERTEETFASALWTVECLQLLSKTLEYQGEAQQASLRSQEAYDLSVRALGPRHPKTLVSVSNMENLLIRLGRDIEAAASRARLVRLTEIGENDENDGGNVE
jgi:hypothetical protein